MKLTALETNNHFHPEIGFYTSSTESHNNLSDSLQTVMSQCSFSKAVVWVLLSCSPRSGPKSLLACPRRFVTTLLGRNLLAGTTFEAWG